MRYLVLVFVVGTLTAGEQNPVVIPVRTATKTTVREFEVPQPPLTVTELVPVQKEVPQPPKRFQEVTTTYVRELPSLTTVCPAPAVTLAPACPAPVRMAEAVRVVPAARVETSAVVVPIVVVPVGVGVGVGRPPTSQYGRNDIVQFNRHIFGGTTTRYADGATVERGSFGRIRSYDRLPSR